MGYLRGVVHGMMLGAAAALLYAPKRSRAVIRAFAVGAGIVVRRGSGIFWGLVVPAFGVAAAVLVVKRPPQRRTGWGAGWKPAIQHQELPPPPQDPEMLYGEPLVETFASHAPPLAELQLPPALRGQLDGFALGRAKRIVEAPHLLTHAAADSESWPQVEEAVARALAVAEAHHAEVGGDGKPPLFQALALWATQSLLPEEWRHTS